ncbi:hypothetical protein D3C87_988820 [compost metagenome]
MKDYVIKVFDNREDTEPSRVYEVKAKSVEEAVIEAAKKSADWEMKIEADPKK